MKKGWLLYDEADLKQNRDFADYLTREGKARGLELETVRTVQQRVALRNDGAVVIEA